MSKAKEILDNVSESRSRLYLVFEGVTFYPVKKMGTWIGLDKSSPTYPGVVGIAMMRDGSPEFDGDVPNVFDLTAPESSEVDLINRVLGTRFDFYDFAGR